jgi:hypothetical protein
VRSADGAIRSRESRYFVTSIDPASVTASELQSYVRGHWQVENCLHFIKDRWWDEDRHYTKRPGLAEVFASLTNAALSVLRLIHRRTAKWILANRGGGGRRNFGQTHAAAHLI